jgi:F420-non-reducing hydrogenase iron-sulfur subunit
LNQQAAEQATAIKLNEDYCASCSLCASLCPFEAIKRDPETRKMVLEIEKCQVCGICYSTCPAKAIDIFYYDLISLTRYLENARREYSSDTLVVMCKGSSPDFDTAGNLFEVSKFIPLSVPCVGRLSEDIFLKAITSLGIKKIYVLACDENYCRFEKGSALNGRRVTALNLLLERLGFGEDVIVLKRNSAKVKADRDKCIRCGNCVFYCPYEAPKLYGTDPASFDLELCQGCGICVAICPALALELEGWEKAHISALISELCLQMQQPKILVFRCQWSTFPLLDGDLEPNVRFIDLPCAGRVDTSHVLEAFALGVGGVMVVACPAEECKLKEGSKEAYWRTLGLKEKLHQIGLGERLNFYSTTPRYPQSFTQELRQFKKRLETIAEGG